MEWFARVDEAKPMVALLRVAQSHPKRKQLPRSLERRRSLVGRVDRRLVEMGNAYRAFEVLADRTRLSHVHCHCHGCRRAFRLPRGFVTQASLRTTDALMVLFSEQNRCSGSAGVEVLAVVSSIQASRTRCSVRRANRR